MQISLAWWNTSLSPLAKPRATDEEKEIAFEVVRYLLNQLKIDCLALGEVAATDLTDFIEHCELHEFDAYNGSAKHGSVQFDIGLLYRREKLRYLGDQRIVSSRGGTNLKVARRIDMLAPDSDFPLHLFVSHWPSRRWNPQNSSERHRLGVNLRDAVDDLDLHYGRPANVILLGDYNDDPFDLSLSEQLQATRDRLLVQKKSRLLYNPFWRHLGEHEPHPPNDSPEGAIGTYFFSSGPMTRWHTFDQIIFSSAFLGGGEWQLDEKRTQILRLPPLAELVRSPKSRFDHYPILSVIRREQKND